MKRNDRDQNTNNKYKRNSYSFVNITPSYKLRAEEDVVHNFLGQGYVCHGGAGPLEIIHQVLVVARVLFLWEARIHQAKIVPRAQLGYCQSDDNIVANSMKGHLPGAHRDVLEASL